MCRGFRVQGAECRKTLCGMASTVSYLKIEDRKLPDVEGRGQEGAVLLLDHDHVYGSGQGRGVDLGVEILQNTKKYLKKTTKKKQETTKILKPRQFYIVSINVCKRELLCDTMTVSGVTHRSYFQRDLPISTVVTFGHPETGYYIE